MEGYVPDLEWNGYFSVATKERDKEEAIKGTHKNQWWVVQGSREASSDV
jgi:hypothetical protein